MRPVQSHPITGETRCLQSFEILRTRFATRGHRLTTEFRRGVSSPELCQEPQGPAPGWDVARRAWWHEIRSPQPCPMESGAMQLLSTWSDWNFALKVLSVRCMETPKRPDRYLATNRGCKRYSVVLEIERQHPGGRVFPKEIVWSKHLELCSLT